MGRPLVSIIVPVYNVEKYLRECLDSLVHQTYKNIEIICVNDGSKDDSQSILDEFEYMYPSKVTCYSKDNGGLSSARNYGLDRAKGKYIMFIDSDDFIEKDTVTQAVANLEKTATDLYVFGIQQFCSDGDTEDIINTNDWFKRRMQPAGYQELTFERAQKTNIHVCNKVFRRDLIKDLRFPEGLLFEDIYFTWSYMLAADTVVYNDDVYYHYRVHSESIMAKAASSYTFDKLLHHLENWHRLFIDSCRNDTVRNRFSELRALLLSLSERVKELAPESYCKIIQEYAKLYNTELSEAVSTPDVSIIVPVYNVEKYLKQCLDSLVHQSLQNIEIICVDDGSTDSSGTILEEYAKRYSTIKVIHKENGGLSSARNIGLRIAKASYIAFVDSDDYVDTTLFERAYKAITRNDVDFVVYGAVPFDDDINTEQKADAQQYWLSARYSGTQQFNFALAKDTPQCAWNKLYKADKLKDFHFAEGLLYEDVSFTWLYYFRSQKAYYIDKNLYFYRIRQNSIMDDALKTGTYDKAVHHLKNVEYVIEQMSWDKQQFLTHIEGIQFILDRHTRRAKRMLIDKTEQHRIDEYSANLQVRFNSLQKLYRRA